MTREDFVELFNNGAGNKKHWEGGDILPHATCFAEEIGELGEAIGKYLEDQSDENRRNLAKEWADSQVTLSNIAWFFELNGEEAFKRVAENNLTKLVDGKLLKNENGKVLKPEGYVKPNMGGL